LAERNPVGPVDPVDPVDPVEPVEPVDPVLPVDPVEPVEPMHPGLLLHLTASRHCLPAKGLSTSRAVRDRPDIASDNRDTHKKMFLFINFPCFKFVEPFFSRESKQVFPVEEPVL
jgi:hypothetical protein